MTHDVWLVDRPGHPRELPLDASTCRVIKSVADRLKSLNFAPPVRLADLPSYWWTARVDIAALDGSREPRCATQEVDITAAQMEAHFAGYFCELIAGPFESKESIEGTYLVFGNLDVGWLGARARVREVRSWIAAGLKSKGFATPVKLGDLHGKHWVCGMSGGVRTTEELARLCDTSADLLAITHGPFDTETEASHAFDVLWESPE